MQKATDAVAFDIDGVLKRGDAVLPGAKQALQILLEKQIPFIFMTNGGGRTQRDFAETLGNLLELDFPPSHFVLSHSPMSDLSTEFADKRVLVLGRDAEAIAREDCMLSKPVTVEDFARNHPGIYPWREFQYLDPKPLPYSEEPLAAAIIFHDPIDWHLDIQVLCDVLKKGPPFTEAGAGQAIPLFVSNPDFTFSSSWPTARFAQGAFVSALSHLYQKLYNEELKLKQYGKPLPVQFRYGEKVLEDQCRSMNLSPQLSKIFMIGDNPAADVRGANNAGDRWSSVLVRTGLFEGHHPPTADPPDHIFDCVQSAIVCITNHN
eukprot:CAMPEP_0117743924 /NCGR_PEP_ID=MMETSP0947-20121206/6435_1 /TAXON_ID=44440 /ORGANISM="Chattonella subsalsa, Strain CCMP2191" /LENGTH=319 /DNA_ID=CAMNT_0005560739 /DNA_START=232 /DNA_END=1192 /DNA_ORIENTATION=+